MKPSLIRILCDRSAEAIEWLIAMGAEFQPEKRCFAGVESVRRGHPCHGAGGSIAEVLVNAAGARSIETALKTRVTGLLHEDDKVVSVRTADMELRAGAVVLTSGGFGNNRAMLKRHFRTTPDNELDAIFAKMFCHGDVSYQGASA